MKLTGILTASLLLVALFGFGACRRGADAEQGSAPQLQEGGGPAPQGDPNSGNE